jgi:lipopolysaccharide/colanic/teichoic acid biosynthesis glycosyltransferase
MSPVSVQLETINDQNQLSLVDVPSNSLSLIVKTMSDLYFSITALILASPLLLLIALDH